MQALVLNFEKSSEVENTQVVHFQGAFDGGMKDSIAPLQTMVDDENNKNFVLDFTQLTFLNSYAIGQLVSWHNSLAKRGGRMIITGPQKNITDIFGIVGIDKIITVTADMAGAVASLKG